MDEEFDPLAIDVPRLLSALGIAAEHVGDRWVARCPSGQHVDATPSWDMKDEPGHHKNALHHCLSCHFQGGAIHLVAHVLGIGKASALDWILERAMGDAPIVQRVATEIVRDDGGFRLPPEVVVAPFAEWPDSPRSYVLGRRITPEQVERWRLGYAVERRAKNQKGLVGRIVIPAYERGGAVHYTARTFDGSPKRYLTAHRSEGAKESAVFGEQYWPAQRDRSLVAVTEGAFNAMAVERVAAMPVASLFGSAVKLEHLAKLSTFRAALLVTDPDMAGDRAAEKLMLALARHVEIVRVELPRGGKQDADSVDPAVLRGALADAWARLPIAIRAAISETAA